MPQTDIILTGHFAISSRICWKQQEKRHPARTIQLLECSVLPGAITTYKALTTNQLYFNAYQNQFYLHSFIKSYYLMITKANSNLVI